MMDQILPVVYMIGVLLLVLPAFLQSNLTKDFKLNYLFLFRKVACDFSKVENIDQTLKKH